MRYCIIFLCAIFTCSYPSPSMYNSFEVENGICGIEIVLPASEFSIGENIPARCLLLYADGTREEAASSSVRWHSSNEKVCAIIDNMPRAVGRGKATLGAEFEHFSATKLVSVIAPPDYSKLLISEVYYDAQVLADAEFIEIWNISDDEIDISGCSIAEGSGSYAYTFPANTGIAGGKKIVLPRNKESFFQEFGFYADLPSSNIVLGNSGETIILQKPDGSLIDIVFVEGGDSKYPQTTQWCKDKLPNAPKGYSVIRKSDNNTYSCADWDVGRPTPGK